MASLLVRFLRGMLYFRSCENQAGPNVRSKGSIRRQGTPGDVKRLRTASKTGQPASPVEAGKNPRSSGRGVSKGPASGIRQGTRTDRRSRGLHARRSSKEVLEPTFGYFVRGGVPDCGARRDKVNAATSTRSFATAARVKTITWPRHRESSTAFGGRHA